MFRKCSAILYFLLMIFFSGYLRASPVKSFIFPVADNGLFATRTSQLALAGYYIEQSFNTTYAQGYCSNNYLVNTTPSLCSAVGGIWRYGHNGIDLNGKSGGNTDCYRSIYAAAAGKITLINSSGWGKMIRIEHDTRFGKRYSFYAHLDQFNVQDGAGVLQGQAIGTIGKTGSGAGPNCHLHFLISTTTSAGNGYYYAAGVPSSFIDPVSFIENYAFTYDGNGYACDGTVTGGGNTNWEYSCGPAKTVFAAGSTVHAMIHINSVKLDHRFKAQFYRNGSFVREETTGWNYVGSGWDKAYTWPTQSSITAGNWIVKIFVDTGDGFPPQPIKEISFTVNAPAPYTYDNNGRTCLGPVTGGQATDWEYTCNNASTTFTAGDDVYALFRLDDIMSDHRYKVRAYRNNSFQWEWATEWNYVGSGWEYGYFWPALYDATAGTWRLDAFVDTGSGFPATPFGSVSFTVAAGSQYFSYDGNGATCRGPVTGDAYTNWVYTCKNPGTSFPHGNDVYGLVSISNISRSHQFRVMAFRDGVAEFDWVTDWNVIPLGGWWNYAYFWPVAEDAEAGDWSFYVFVRTTENNQRYTLIKQLDFEVY